MAPKQQTTKVMKVMDLHVFKHVFKKPATAKPMVAPLFAETLKQLEGQSDHAIEAFLNKLSLKEQNLLWKKFEGKRKSEGSDASYKEATSGTGSRAKAHELLKCFLQSGGTTKGEFYTDHLASVSVTKTYKNQGTWRPLKYMLDKFGKHELQSRCEAGTIAMRKNPDDPRFAQFKEIEESEGFGAEQLKAKSGKHKGAGGFQDFKAICGAQISGGLHLDFYEEKEDDEEPDVSKIFKRKGGESSSSREVLAGFEDKPVSNDTKDDQDLETASQLGDKSSAPKVKESYKKVYNVCLTTKAKLERAFGEDHKFEKVHKPLLDSLGKDMKLLNKMGQDSKTNPSHLKRMVVKTATLAKEVVGVLKAAGKM